MSDNSQLQFVPPCSFVQPSFWNKLTDLKINVDKLKDDEREVYGFFSNTPITWSTHILEVDSTSYNSSFTTQNNVVPFHGKIFNKNTIEQFKDCDKTELISQQGKAFLEELKTGSVLEKPSKLNSFFILSFSDLKKYHFYYWFAFPVPHCLPLVLNKISSIGDHLDLEKLLKLSQEYFQLDVYQRAYFLMHNGQLCTLKSKLKGISEVNYTEFYFCFADFLSQEKHPRSQLKNYIILILHYCPFLSGRSINLLLFFLDKKLSCSQSVVYNITLPRHSSTNESILESAGGTWVGWEKNEKNKFGPRFSNMKATMDPQVLFEESVDLNLKLMKWRLMPDIDLEKIKNTKCLLLGAGTLGCSVARNLLGWGIRTITFVDNGNVSYSNPVRQHLFNYEDAVSNKSKAQAAADNLRKVFPTVNTNAHQFTIPMPGHNVGESTLGSVIEIVEKLKQLVQDHDVIFLLTDSRESRWLPTLLGVFYQKIIINVALGFDTYLIMRYGRDAEPENCEGSGVQEGSLRKIFGTELGCYFCNDVTAPGDSMKDRTLDQQCTVTRPGVSSVAGALAVELTVSILQHEKGINAPAFYQIGAKGDLPDQEESSGILGIVPHSIRGFLSSFSHVLPATPRYTQCIACSTIVVEEYRKRSFEFLLDVFNNHEYLENLTGLSLLFDEGNFANVLEVSEDDDEWGG